MRSVFLLLSALAAAGDPPHHGGSTLASATDGAAPSMLHRYVLLGPENTHIVRAIMTGDSAGCPHVVAEGPSGVSVKPMSIRAVPSAAYPVLTCEAELGADVTRAIVVDEASGETWRAPLLQEEHDRVYLFGDTGCRVDGNHSPQGCHNASDWAFASVMRSVAQAEPGLAVHVGDYVYRDVECPPDATDLCGGSAFGSTYATWKEDFFEPASAALETMPWVFVRGNHENCAGATGAEGFFRFLYNGPYVAEGSCPDFTPPFRVRMHDFDLHFVDSSVNTQEHPRGLPGGVDIPVEELERQVTAFAGAFSRVMHWVEHGDKPALLITHRPIYGVRMDAASHTALTEDVSLQTALGRVLMDAPLPTQLRATVAGHTHVMQTIIYDSDGCNTQMHLHGSAAGSQPHRPRAALGLSSGRDERAKTLQAQGAVGAGSECARPPQLYLGNGGTSMAPELPSAAMLQANIDGLAPQQGFSMARYGYAVMHRHNSGNLEALAFEFRDVGARPLATVLLA